MIKDYIEGQKDIKNMLLQAYHNNRLSHAYIFSGSEGVGKREMALYFAAMLYCKEAEVCYDCESCKQIFDNKHVNVYEIFPDRDIIRVPQIEKLQEEFSMTSLVEGPRVYIINNADKLNQASANKLLKFIEEPINDHTYGILLTSNVSDILPTIISRCNIISFKAMPKDILLSFLLENGMDNIDAEITKELTNDIESAMTLATSEIYASVKNLVLELLEVRSVKDGVMYSRNHSNELYDPKTLRMYLELLILVYEDLLNNEPIRFKSIDLKDYRNYKLSLNDNKIKIELEHILKMRRMLNSNVNIRGIVSDLFINLI